VESCFIEATPKASIDHIGQSNKSLNFIVNSLMAQMGTKLKVIILRNHKTHQIFNLSSIYGKLVVGGLQSISLSSKLKKMICP